MNQFKIYYRSIINPNIPILYHRCQNQERRITVTLRSTEGELGDLVVTVVAALSPYKAAKVRDGGILGQILEFDQKYC